MSMTRNWLGVMALVLCVGCTAEQTEEGELPEVDVTTEGGNMPEYDVDPAQVEVGADTSTIVTPDVDVEPAPDNR